MMFNIISFCIVLLLTNSGMGGMGGMGGMDMPGMGEGDEEDEEGDSDAENLPGLE